MQCNKTSSKKNLLIKIGLNINAWLVFVNVVVIFLDIYITIRCDLFIAPEK